MNRSRFRSGTGLVASAATLVAACVVVVIVNRSLQTQTERVARSPSASGQCAPPSGAEPFRGLEQNHAVGDTIQGHVVDTANEPCAGVIVCCSESEAPRMTESHAAQTTTDVDGGFVVEWTGARAVDIAIDHPGHAPYRLRGCIVPATLRICLSKSKELRVAVRDGSNPVVAARVSCLTGGLRCPGPEAVDGARLESVTNSSGECSFGLAGYGLVVLYVRHPTYVDVDEEVEITDDPVVKAEISLHSGADVRGRVVDAASERPLVNASVGMGALFERAVQTNGDGEFVLRGVAPDSYVYARFAGYALQRTKALYGAPLLFRLERGWAAYGRIVNGDRRPVPSAHVRLIGIMDVPLYSDVEFHDVRADATGWFRVDDLRPEVSVVLQVRANDGSALDRDLVLRQTETDLGEVTLDGPRSVAGTVTYAGGSPASRIAVELRASRRGYESRGSPALPASLIYADERRVRTADDGSFVFHGLAPAVYDVSIAGGVITRLADVKDVSEQALDVTLPWDRHLAIYVKGPAALLARGVSVTATSDARTVSAYCRELGRADIWLRNDERVLTIEATASAADGAHIVAGVTGAEIRGDFVVIELVGGATVSGQVIGHDGVVRAGAVVKLRVGGRYLATAVCDAAGRFSFVLMGEYPKVDVVWDGFISRFDKKRPHFVGEEGTVSGVRAGTEDVVLYGQIVEANERLVVVVQRLDGSPVEGARLLVLPYSSAVGVTDETGRAMVDGLPARRVEVTCGLPDGEVLGPVEVVPAGQEVVLRAQPTTMATGRVFWPNGSGADAVEVSLYTDGRKLGKTLTASDGRFEIQVPVGIASIEVRASARVRDQVLTGEATWHVGGSVDVRLRER